MGNVSKKYNYVEANVMNIYAKFQLHLLASEKKIFEYFLFENLAFRLPSKSAIWNQNQRFGQNAYGW